MQQFIIIDTKIQEGYSAILEGDYLGGCDKWLDAWEDIKDLFISGIATDIYDLDNKDEWTQYPSNYVQDLEMELHNAGVDDKIYHQKRIDFCKELMQWCKDELTANNARIAMAEAYFELGDQTSGEQIFTEWIRDDPDSGMAYGGWSDCYRYHSDEENHEKIADILLAGYVRPELKDRAGVVERLVSLYEEVGIADRARKFRSELKQLLRVVKVGRNDPCPCGSGKKFKKCCGTK